MGQEVGSAGLLAEREGRTEGQGGCQKRPREPRARVQQHEIESHQGESGGGVGTREAGRARQVMRPALEESDIGTSAAETRNVPWAVHVRRKLESANDQGAERHRHGDECRLSTMRPEPGVPAASNSDGERRDADRDDEPLAATVEQAYCPPSAGPQPGMRICIEEPGARYAAVEIKRVNHGRNCTQADRRQPEMEQPERSCACDTARCIAIRHVQKLRLV